MKLIVQIPCYNEEETLPVTVADIPRYIPGIDTIEILVIDDGSRDRTVEVAHQLGVDHVVRHICNRGLARTFRTGLDAAVKLGADIIVNTDADNQYCGADIAKLVEPILRGEAQIVVGDRQTDTIAHFSGFKKVLQRFGSAVVRRLSETDVVDTVSGFRAFSRDAALQLNIVSPFSYTIETVIQAGKKGMAVVSVPIRTNGKTRESRLFKSIPHFLKNSGATIVRMYSMYQPLRVFFYLSLLLIGIGSLPVIRFLYFYFQGGGAGHIQSLVLGGVLIITGAIAGMIGLVADLISFNRQLIEITLEKVRRLETSATWRDDLGVQRDRRIERASDRHLADEVPTSSVG